MVRLDDRLLMAASTRNNFVTFLRTEIGTFSNRRFVPKIRNFSFLFFVIKFWILKQKKQGENGKPGQVSSLSDQCMIDDYSLSRPETPTNEWQTQEEKIKFCVCPSRYDAQCDRVWDREGDILIIKVHSSDSLSLSLSL